jgi:four helix bundle protein
VAVGGRRRLVTSFQFSVFSFQFSDAARTQEDNAFEELEAWKRGSEVVFSFQFSEDACTQEGTVGYHSFEELEVWKRACLLAVQLYEALQDCRHYALCDQMRRAAVSIPSNIAEGAERGGKDFVRFLRVARGSAAELRTQCYIASRIGALPANRALILVAELKEISKMLTGLARSLNSEN